MPSIDLADKTTLDDVKVLLGIANPTSADLTTVMNALKKIDNNFPISGGIKSVQRGKYQLTQNTYGRLIITISAVTTSKTFINVAGLLPDAYPENGDYCYPDYVYRAVGYLLSSTQLEIRYRAKDNRNQELFWEVIEFN